VNDAACLSPRSARTQSCNQGLCDGPRPSMSSSDPLPPSGAGSDDNTAASERTHQHQGHWLSTAWSVGCVCGSGVQTRRVACSAATAAACDATQRPAETRPCARACTEPQWFSGPWSQCSAACGPGHQWRPVLCVRHKAAVGDEQCAAHERPTAKQACEQRPCGGQWFASEWGACEHECGPQSREVRCLDQAATPALDCASTEKPAARRACSSCSKCEFAFLIPIFPDCVFCALISYCLLEKWARGNEKLTCNTKNYCFVLMVVFN
jgi:Thrombospondin type 1 domain